MTLREGICFTLVGAGAVLWHCIIENEKLDRELEARGKKFSKMASQKLGFELMVNTVIDKFDNWQANAQKEPGNVEQNEKNKLEFLSTFNNFLVTCQKQGVNIDHDKVNEICTRVSLS